MKAKTLKNLINRRLHALRYYNKVAVEVIEEKRVIYMTEVEIRALQVEAAMRYKYGGQKCFDAFVSQFIIYDGPKKRGSKPMVLRTDGIFETEFRGGFFSASSSLVFELF